MVSSLESYALKQVVDQLEGLVGEKAKRVDFEPGPADNDKMRSPDIVIEVGNRKFFVEYKSSSQLVSIASGIERLKHLSANSRAIRLLAVPFMGESGMRKCEEAGISWLDLSGNAEIKAPGLRVHVRGKENKFKSRGRKENPFAFKSSRITRRLLSSPEKKWTQRELSESTGLGEGFVSRIVKTLEAQKLIDRGADNKISLAKPALLLDAWRQGYDFDKHKIIKGHVAGRSGEDVQIKISHAFRRYSVEHAATGLGAAWLYAKFAAFRTVSFYLKQWPGDERLKDIGFRETTSGANVWLILPKDPDVFYDTRVIDNIPAVDKIQVWLDLKSHPERSEEAADELRKTMDL